jgi:hypothetical protein
MRTGLIRRASFYTRATGTAEYISGLGTFPALGTVNELIFALFTIRRVPFDCYKYLTSALPGDKSNDAGNYQQ